MATRGTGTSNRGFASMDPEKQRAIAAQGGRAAHAQGVAHEFDSDEARAAGRKGGQARSSRSAAARAVSLANADRDIQEPPPVSPMHAISDVWPRGGHL
ncbi:general stress protein [Lysobacter dokdonensis DS-58]|uniref:General stress protein n=1 Tax=Lysobacter dokdonensis DS-58 TaxID=1300345 RepID=A0A0A2WHN0_9GAMM|nr:KGG domain-containing protein [Lysobacter dokdonensis]KGQ18202.1 general stress protein [Lysobacter dokdonensis DS-58]